MELFHQRNIPSSYIPLELKVEKLESLISSEQLIFSASADMDDLEGAINICSTDSGSE